MSHRALPLVMGLVMAVAGLVAPSMADAQGNGRPKGPRSGTTPATPTPSPAPAPAPATSTTTAATTSTTQSTNPTLQPATVSTFRQFGAWLDDTSAPTPGEGYTSFGMGHWRMSGLSQTNMPMIGVGIGLTDRLAVGGSLPFYRVNYGDATVRGMDDVYLSAKYTLVDPTLTVSEVGLAISPVVEILSAGAPDGRVHFGVPISLEVRRAPFRVYGSAGYFTRGSVFSGAALEWMSSRRFSVSGGLTQSYSLKDDPTLDGLGVSRQRIDVTGTVGYPFGNVAGGFVSVGRSLSSIEQGGTQFSLSGGVSLRFSRSAATTPVTPPSPRR